MLAGGCQCRGVREKQFVLVPDSSSLLSVRSLRSHTGVVNTSWCMDEGVCSVCMLCCSGFADYCVYVALVPTICAVLPSTFNCAR